MEQAQYNQLFSHIWNIATDVLVYAFEKGEYKNIIMPMTVLRRIDVLLEPTKDAVLRQKELLDANHIDNQDPLLFITTGYPFYNTSKFTMKTLKSETDPLRLKLNFIDYLNGYSKDVQDILDKFHIRQKVDNLTEAERLGSIIEKFTDDKINLSIKPVLNDEGEVVLPGLDNHTMGTMFEELLRRFNEEHNVTEAGEHFTPRDYVKLLTDIAILPVKDKIESSTYSVYDGASGTGGILTITKERIEEIAREHGKKVNVEIFGQELTPESYATCKADLMMSGSIQSFQYPFGTEQREYICFDSTISRDGHAGETFDFCISNPPFGTPWKEDLKKRGLSDKEKAKFTDSRFTIYNKGEEISFLPDIGDCQMMFLANNLSRMKETTALGTRIVEVHNGSSLFTGNAGGGESNLRRYIIENDLLEAIIAMPEKDFYNTGIGTYIWVVTNRKEARRKGKVQLIDATKICSPLRKNLGEKNCETSEADRRRIIDLLLRFEESPESKIFPNEEFGYWQVPVLRPKRDADGNIILKKGKPVMAKNRNEVEQIPLLYPGGISAFYEKEVKPYDDEAEFGEPIIGYELSFTKYFYKPVELPSIESILEDIRKIEIELEDYRNDICNAVTRGLNPNVKMKDTGIAWLPEVPEHWEMRKMKYVFNEISEKGHPEEQPLCSTQAYGVIPQSMYDNRVVVVSKGFENLKFVKVGDFVISLRSFQGGIELAHYQGIISAAYTILRIRDSSFKDYYRHLFKSHNFIQLLQTCVTGIREGQNINYPLLSRKQIPVPPLSEQQAIVDYINSRTAKIDTLTEKLKQEIEHLKLYKQRLISDVVTGQIKVC